MTALLATLVLIYRQLATKDMSTSEATAIKLPFSIYTAWISVAIIANITALLVKVGWAGWGLSDSSWVVVVLVVSTLIGLGVGLVWRDPAFIWVFVWAFFGILVNHVTTLNGKYQDVIITLTVLMPILAVYALLMGIGHLMVLREQRTSIRGS